MAAKTILRRATHDDLDLLMDVGEAMHSESPRFSRLSYSPAKVLDLFVQLMALPNGFLMVAESDGVLQGGMAGIMAPHWFSEDLVAHEYGLFLLPQYRGNMTGARLVRSYVDWAEQQGAKLIQLGISTGIHTEETAALYRALGLKQVGYLFEV